MAARVAKCFGLDPVAVLDDSGDDLLNAVRMAAVKVIREDERKEAEQRKAGSRPSGRRPRRR
jgi:hypothetical protein